MKVLRVMRRHPAGRHLSNSFGALASLMMARMVLVTGPLIGAMIWAPLEMVWVAAGLSDLRMLVAAMAVLVVALLRLYVALGWLD